MKRLVLVSLALASCKRTPPPPPPPAAADAAPVVTAEPNAKAERPTRPRRSTRDGGAPAAPASFTPQPPLPPASDALELVAVGRRWGSKLISLQALGDHVWLSAVDLDAHADREEPLTKGPDPLAKLPYDAKKHRVEVVGVWPDLFALRTKDVNGRMESPEAAVFVRKGEEWKPAKPLPSPEFPHAFVAWNGGALLVSSQIALNAMPDYSPRQPGTSLVHVDAEGNVAAPKIDLPRRFLAWTADGDGKTFSLLGTMAVAPAADAGPEELTFGGVGLVVVRSSPDAKGGVTTTTLLRAPQSTMSYGIPVREREDVAVVFRRIAWDLDEAWKPAFSAVLLVGPNGVKPRPIPADESCMIPDATVVNGAVYFARSCMTKDFSYATAIVRVAEDGRATEVKVPLLAKKEGGGFRVAKDGDKTVFGCEVKSFVARGESDLWVQAQCGGNGSDAATIPAVFRLGRPQEPVVIP